MKDTIYETSDTIDENTKDVMSSYGLYLWCRVLTMFSMYGDDGVNR